MSLNKVIFLGTGTSQGVPMIGCNCHVCSSQSNKDKRLRTAAYIEYDGVKFVIDCGPDFRQQMLTHSINELDAVLLTHQHKDHTGGLDDIRAYNYFTKAAFPVYAEKRVQESLKKEYSYAFDQNKYPGVPEYNLITIDETPFNIITNKNGIERSVHIVPIRVMHYKLPILGYRIGNFAYITDGSFIPEAEFDKLKGVKTFVINTIRHEKHISHFSLGEALEIIKRVGAPRNYLTHLSHQIGTHQELTKELQQMNMPYSVEPAYDGLTINI